MYLSSYVVCADLVCILWVSTIHMCPWGIIFSIYHNSARLCCLTQRASDLVEWGPMLQCAREGWNTLCSPDNFADNFAPLEQFSSASKHTLLLNTLYSLTHFNPQQTLHLRTLCSPEHFALRNSLLPGTVYFLEHFALSIPGRKVCWGEKYSRRQSVPKSSVPGSKMC